jgi:hypothetical protein
VLKVGEVSRRKQPVSPKLRSCEGGKRAKADCSPFYFLLSFPATPCVESAYLIVANERYAESFGVRNIPGLAPANKTLENVTGAYQGSGRGREERDDHRIPRAHQDQSCAQELRSVSPSSSVTSASSEYSNDWCHAARTLDVRAIALSSGSARGPSSKPCANGYTRRSGREHRVARWRCTHGLL